MPTPNSNGPGIPGADAAARGLDSAADAVETATDYVRENDAKGMLSDFQGLVKKNPGPALLGAAALGFLIARIFSRG